MGADFDIDTALMVMGIVTIILTLGMWAVFYWMGAPQ